MADQTKYRVLKGIDWDNDKQHAEPGEVRDDIPAKAVRWLLDDGAIEAAEDLSLLKRDELDQRARDAGIQDPDKLPNKEAVIDAIDKAEGQ